MFRQTIGIVSMALVSGGHVTPPLSLNAHAAQPRAHASTGKTVARNAKARTSTYPLPAGYGSWYLNDPECPGSPDSFAYFVEYWNEDESFAYDVPAGHSSYYCGTVFKGQTLDASSAYQTCVSNSPPQWNCQLLFQTWQEHP